MVVESGSTAKPADAASRRLRAARIRSSATARARLPFGWLPSAVNALVFDGIGKPNFPKLHAKSLGLGWQMQTQRDLVALLEQTPNLQEIQAGVTAEAFYKTNLRLRWVWDRMQAET